MNCPRCGAQAQGNFCSACGASLQTTPCPKCGTQPAAGDRFCNKCGTFIDDSAQAPGAAPARAVASGSGSNTNLAWVVAGGLVVVLVVVLVAPRIGQQPPPPPPAAQPAGGGAALGSSAVDLNSMTPREAADRLFTRVMTAVSAGDSTEVSNFLPMAVGAYELAMPLDADGYFHMALLRLTGLDMEGALAAAEAGLEETPGHLLLLSAAAEAAVTAGDDETATRHYQELVDGWDTQMALALPEYQAHNAMLPQMQADAQEYLANR